MSTDIIELVVVEDDPRTMKSLVKLLGSFPDFQVVGSAVSGESALETIGALKPTVALLDLELPGIDGIEVTKRIKKIVPEVEILILTSFEDEVKVYKAMQAGAGGYLVKGRSSDKIHDAIKDVLAGGTVIEPRLAKRFWNYFQSIQAGPSQDDKNEDLLDPIERDILQMIARGLTNQETGRVLDMERRTVRSHLSHIYRKLGTSSRAEAVTIALKNGWISI